MIGIYQITVDGDARVYIGSSRNILRRWYEHRSMLRNGRHHCVALQSAFDKAGIGGLRHSVIVECSADNLPRLERENLRANEGRLFNTILWATFNRSGLVMPEAAKAKISQRLAGNRYRKGIPHDDATKARIRNGVRRAYQEGRKKPVANPANLSAYNAALSRGEVVHPKRNPDRDAAIVALHMETRSLKKTGEKFGITPSAVWHVVKRCAPGQTRKWERKLG